jgi:hypothetical protein
MNSPRPPPADPFAKIASAYKKRYGPEEGEKRFAQGFSAEEARRVLFHAEEPDPETLQAALELSYPGRVRGITPLGQGFVDDVPFRRYKPGKAFLDSRPVALADIPMLPSAPPRTPRTDISIAGGLSPP